MIEYMGTKYLLALPYQSICICLKIDRVLKVMLWCNNSNSYNYKFGLIQLHWYHTILFFDLIRFLCDIHAHCTRLKIGLIMKVIS